MSIKPAFSTLKRNSLYYFFAVSAMGFGVFFMLHVGSRLSPPISRTSTGSIAVTTPHLAEGTGSSFFASMRSSLRRNATNPLSRLLLQVFVIIGASGAVALAFYSLWTIGYDMGILSQRIFTMFGTMALVTTVMTGSLVRFFGKARQVGQAISKRRRNADHAQPA